MQILVLHEKMLRFSQSHLLPESGVNKSTKCHKAYSKIMEIHNINICNFVFWISFSLLKAKGSFLFFFFSLQNITQNIKKSSESLV